MSDTSIVKSRKPLSLDEFRKQRKPPRNINKEILEKLSALDRLAYWITNRVGTMGFFLIVLIWTVLWLGWNLLAPKDLQFDPPMAFVFWPVSYTHLRAHETRHDIVCRLLLE